MKSAPCFSTATAADTDKISRILEKSFKITKDRKAWLDGQMKVFLDDPSCWRTISVNDQLIGTIHIKKHWLKIGRSKILKGDVSGVSILPEYHGKGYGSLLMGNSVEWMREKDYDISRLGGLVDFYARFGYLRFPRRYMEFSAGNSVSAGASEVKEEALPLPARILSKIRPYDETKDFSDYVKLYNKFNGVYNGFYSIGEKDKPSAGGPDPLRIVFKEKGKMLGYLFASQHPAAANKSDKSIGEITIGNTGYERSCPEILEYLIKYINNFACDNGLKIITARIPFDPEIINVISKIPIQFQCNETYGGKAANMLQVINIGSLFKRLIPELESRLKNSVVHGWKGIVQIGIEKDKTQLYINNGTIKLADGEKPSLRFAVKEADLLKLILGMLSFREIPSDKTKYGLSGITLLNDLFPRKLPTSSNWG